MGKKIVIIDGQGGKMGQLLIEQIKAKQIKCEICSFTKEVELLDNLFLTGRH